MAHDRNSLFSRLTAFMGVCLFASGSGAAFAQQAGPESGTDRLADIVVTAEKVSENIEKAPLAITAITGEELRASGAFTATDLSGLVPNFTAAPNSNGSTVAIRGIVTTAQTLTGSPEVSYSVDGVALLAKIDAFQGMYDVNRVEVLRGPQGTLYGADANAGAINVITNKPDLSGTSASGSVGFGNYSARTATAVFNWPLSSTFGIRFAADEEYHTGYVSLLNSEHKFNDEDYLGMRLSALWKPTSDFTALLTYEASHNGGAGDAGAGSGAPLGLYAVQTGARPYAYQAMPAAPTQDWPIESATLSLSWSLPWVQIDLLSNVHWQDWNLAQPETIYGPKAAYCQNTALPTECHDPGYIDIDDRQDSDELRFSNQNGPVHWLLGLYHVRDVIQYDTIDYPSTFDPNFAELDEYFYTETQNAAYGQVSWNVTNQLALIGGLRYQRDIKNEPAGRSGEIDVPIADIQPPDGCLSNCNHSSFYSGYGEWSKLQWHAGLNYNLNPDSLLFVSVATGYKAGGFNTGDSLPFNPTYGPEDLTDYELGWKAQLFDHRAQINIDAFYMPYDNYQVTTSLIEPSGKYQPVTLNSGKAVIKGVEFESTFLLTPHDKVTFNATALRATFTQFDLPLGDGYCPGGAKICNTNYTGNDLPYAPATTERLAFEHTFPLSDGDSLVAHADTSYSSDYYLDYHNYTAVEQRAYTRSNAWLAWQRLKGDKTFAVRAYIRNIENKAILAGGQGDSKSPGADYNQYGKNGYYLPPLTFGIQFDVSL